MTILDYYLSKQKDPIWYKNYQSIGEKYRGKLFDLFDTNFRKLESFFSQLEAFSPKDGKKRSEWATMDCGQEEDKHRVVNLRNAGFIYKNGDRYYISEKGKEALRLNETKELTAREKWILLFMLVSDYKTDKRDLDLIKTVVNLAEVLSRYNIKRTELLELLKNSCYVTDKKELFKRDIFWILTFYTDPNFINLYLNATIKEKNELSEYVIKCSNDKKSKDCIAHKFVSSGAYSVTTFNNDINICLCVLVITAIQDENWDSFLKLICTFYSSTSEVRIKKFISYNKEIYEDIYKNSFKQIFLKINN